LVDAVRDEVAKILHGVAVAEKLFVDAVRDEVDVLFHDRDHEHAHSLQQAKVDKVETISAKKVIQQASHDEAAMPDLDYCAFNHFPYGWDLH